MRIVKKINWLWKGITVGIITYYLIKWINKTGEMLLQEKAMEGNITILIQTVVGTILFLWFFWWHDKNLINKTKQQDYKKMKKIVRESVDEVKRGIK